MESVTTPVMFQNGFKFIKICEIFVFDIEDSALKRFRKIALGEGRLRNSNSKIFNRISHI